MFQTLETFDTEFSADSVEWCPAEQFNDIFVCGTYQLAPEEAEGLKNHDECTKKKRIGRIYLFQVLKQEKAQLKLLQKLDVPAVLDMKWSHVQIQNKHLLGVVNSNGFLQIYELTEIDDEVTLKLLTEILVNDSDLDKSVLALSLDWSTGKRDEGSGDSARITISDSLGSISLFEFADGEIQRIRLWHAHDFEAWIAAFDYWDTNVVYTGGDDCKFLKFDTRMESGPVITNRSHNAGVTTLQSNWKKEFCLVSGSYDEHLRTWDTRNPRRPLSELNLSGGIWRLKWDPYVGDYLLAACMYNGFFVVDSKNSEQPEIIAEYKEHESIAYGCDWLQKKLILGDEGCTLVGTCSFYDHVLKLSNVKIDGL